MVFGFKSRHRRLAISSCDLFLQVALAYEAVGAYLAQVNERYGPDS